MATALFFGKFARLLNAGTGREIVTLDSLNLTKFELLKVDTEGYELFALLGAQETLTKFKPFTWLETPTLASQKQRGNAHTGTTIRSLLAKLGYKYALRLDDLNTLYATRWFFGGRRWLQ